MTSSSLAANATIRVQLELLSEISLVLRRARISFWLRGGWALDFLLGQITRAHADIDLVAWRRHARRIQALLTAVGYEIAPGPPPEIQTNLRKRGQDISFVWVARTPSGAVALNRVPEWPWLPGALSTRKQTLANVQCHVLSPEQLLYEKVSRGKRRGSQLRDKDRRSIVLLRQMLQVVSAKRQ
jgi:hypothetical protein